MHTNTMRGFAALAIFAASATAQCNPLRTWSIAAAVPFGTLPPSALSARPDGSLVAAGTFTAIGGAAATNIAERRQGIWYPLGAGVVGTISSLVQLGNGDLIAGGSLSSAGGVAVANIARWDGVAWHAVGAGVDGAINAMVVLPDGSLAVGGAFANAGGAPAPFLARWNGSAWSSLGAGTGPTADVAKLAVAANGDLVADGFGSDLARWDGTVWQPIGSPGGTLRGLAATPNGDLFVGSGSGVFRFANGVWTWVGTVMGGSSTILDLAATPDGDLCAVGGFTSVYGPSLALVPASGIARLHDSTWSDFDGTAMPPVTGFYFVSRVAVGDGGALAIGGFLPPANQPLPGGQVPWLYESQPSCPASVVFLGGGCTGPGGANLLRATARPWVGTTFRCEATGIAAPALAATVFGLSPALVPLTNLFAQALPGCDLLVAPDLLDVPFTAVSTVQTQLAVPPSIALAGAVFYAQMVAVQLDQLGNTVAVSSSNALQATIGVF